MNVLGARRCWATLCRMDLDRDALAALGRANLAPCQFPDIPPEPVARNLQEYKCSSKYPEVVAHNLMLAREACVAGSIFYELFTVAMHYTAVACECTLKELYLDRMRLPFEMKRRNGSVTGSKVFTARPTLFEFFHMGWKPIGVAADETKSFSSLIAWAKRERIILPQEERIFEHGRRSRILTAHGHNMVGKWTWGLAAVRETTLVLNRLFPDAETTAYDEANRRREEERRREWDLEYDRLMSATSDEEECD